jgi:hypothetical protein
MTPPALPSPPLLTPSRLAVLVWAAVLGCAVAFTYRSFHWFDSPSHLPPEQRRVDGNSGHTQIDFGGQWLMGRMIVTGNGRRLYHRNTHWKVLRAGYPVADESPVQQEQAALPRFAQSKARDDENFNHDATNLMHWCMGNNRDPWAEWKTLAGASVAPLAVPVGGHPLARVALETAAADAVTPELAAKVEKPSIGGPLYPPVHALFYAPVGAFDSPRTAYHCFQVFAVLLIPVAGLGVKVLTGGRIWWGVATLLLYIYPGTRGGLDLGQNPMITLTILVWGWALAVRGYNVAGGCVWGLLAFKPVWAMAFFLVPLLMWRLRFCTSMLLTGAALGLATLPFVGIDSWFDWLAIGREASALYEVNDNWIHLSRDLQGIPRRALIDFTKPDSERNTPLIHRLAWAAWAVVFATTVVIYLWRGDRKRPTGLGAGFLFLGAYLTCFHFMYYDALLSALALAVLMADPRPYLRARAFAVAPVALAAAVPADRALTPPAAGPSPLGPRMLGYVNSFPLTILMLLLVVENSLSGLELEGTFGVRYFGAPPTGSATEPMVPRVKADTGPRFPLDTYLLLLLWGWCGWRLVAKRDEPTPGPSLQGGETKLVRANDVGGAPGSFSPPYREGPGVGS